MPSGTEPFQLRTGELLRRRHRLLRDAVRAGAAAAACIAFVFPATAAAEVPTRSATAGQPFSFTGPAYSHLNPDSPQVWIDSDHDKCGGPSAAIHWGFPGDPSTNEPADASLVPVASGWQVVVSGTHTFQRGGGVALSSVDITITCDGELQFESYFPWVQVDVSGGGGCAAARTGQAGSAQAACAFPPKVTAPKAAVPPEVKEYFKAKYQKLYAQTSFLCGTAKFQSLGQPLGEFIVFTLFSPYCVTATAIETYYLSMVYDPPDPANAATIVRPRRFALPRVARPVCKSRSCRTIRAATLKFVKSAARVASLSRAMSASVDRFTGARQLAPNLVNDIQVLQFAMTKVYAGKLAATLARKQQAGSRLARLLRRAGVRLAITGAQARARAEKLSRLEGFSKAELRVLKRNGVTRARLRQLLTAAIPFARATSLNRVLRAGESLRTLRRFYHSLSVAQIAYIENRLFQQRSISRRLHATLVRDLKGGLAAHSKRSERVAMRRFVRDAKKVKGIYGSLLRTAGRARTG